MYNRQVFAFQYELQQTSFCISIWLTTDKFLHFNMTYNRQVFAFQYELQQTSFCIAIWVTTDKILHFNMSYNRQDFAFQYELQQTSFCIFSSSNMILTTFVRSALCQRILEFLKAHFTWIKKAHSCDKRHPFSGKILFHFQSTLFNKWPLLGHPVFITWLKACPHRHVQCKAK